MAGLDVASMLTGTPPPMTGIQRAGRALSGLAAGLMGQGPQYLQSLQQQDQQSAQQAQQLDAQRLKAMAMDAQRVDSLLKSGDIQGALRVVDNRTMAIKQLGGDPSDTLRIRQLITAGAIPAAQAEIGEFLSAAKQYGLIEAPQIIPQSAISPTGQMVTMGANGAPSVQSIPGYTPAPEEPKALDLLQVIDGSGVATPIQFDPRGGGFKDMQGNPYTPPPGSTVTRLGTPQGAVGDVIPQTLDSKMRESEGAVRSFNDTASRVIEMVKANPDINTFAAQLGAMGAGALQEAGAIARFLGVPRETFDPGQYQTVFKQAGIENAAIQSLITSLAFQAAAAGGQSGRDVSNRDVERYISQIGGSYSDPAAFLRALQETITGVNREFSNRYESIYKEPFSGDLGVPVFEAPSSDGWRIVPNAGN